jgi:hypothetical protein
MKQQYVVRNLAWYNLIHTRIFCVHFIRISKNIVKAEVTCENFQIITGIQIYASGPLTPINVHFKFPFCRTMEMGPGNSFFSLKVGTPGPRHVKRNLNNKKGVRMWTGLTCLRIESRGGCINTII